MRNRTLARSLLEKYTNNLLHLKQELCLDNYVNYVSNSTHRRHEMCIYAIDTIHFFLRLKNLITCFACTFLQLGYGNEGIIFILIVFLRGYIMKLSLFLVRNISYCNIHGAVFLACYHSATCGKHLYTDHNLLFKRFY